MADPGDEATTIINVKGVRVRTWDRAKACAIRRGETLAAWLNAAVEQVADAQAGAYELPPPPNSSANLPPETANIGQSSSANLLVNLDAKTTNIGQPAAMDALAGLMHGMAALAGASGTVPARADVRRAYKLADAMVRDTAGTPRRPRPIGRAVPQGGEALPLIEGPAQPTPTPAPAEAVAVDVKAPAASPAQTRPAPVPRPRSAARQGAE